MMRLINSLVVVALAEMDDKTQLIALTSELRYGRFRVLRRARPSMPWGRGDQERRSVSAPDRRGCHVEKGPDNVRLGDDTDKMAVIEDRQRADLVV
jgi:hypothetical protein